ncbi:MAG: HEAT repeat domain-containing protein [Cyanobacteriota bacterium]|nr:HEAT repeat domain-containing protein [Cyanobacteriota bacterium]
MDILLGLIIGAIAATAAMFWFLQNQLAEKERERAFELKKLREELEQAHESRLQAAIQAAREDYNNQLEQKETDFQARLSALQDEHQQELARAIAPLPDSASTEAPQTVVPHLGDFEALFEPVEDEEEVKESSESTPTPSTQPPIAATEPVSPAQTVLQSSVTEIKPELEPEIAREGVFSSAPQPAQTVLQSPATEIEPEIVREEVISPTPQPTLEETIAAIANPIHLKPYLRHPSHRARAALAAALGKIVRGQPMHAGISQAVETLAVLTQDRSAVVRQAAVEAIAHVKSDSVIPLLQRALRDPDRKVVKAASAAISRFKFYPAKKSRPRLPANAAQKRT